MPSPTKIRRTAPGCHPGTTAEARGTATTAPSTAPIGSPLWTAAADCAVRAPNSRRLAAATVHTNGSAPGSPSLPPEPSHSNTPDPRPLIPPEDAAARGADLFRDASARGSTDEPDDDITDEGGTKPGLTLASSIGDAVAEAGSWDANGGMADRWRGLIASGTRPSRPSGVEAVAGESLFGESEDGLAAADPAVTPRLPAVLGDTPLEAPCPARDAALTGAFTEESEAVDPAEPVVSANATGIEAIAEPTPNATARAPTRPITPVKVMSSALRRAWISMDGRTFEACTSETTPISNSLS